MELIFKEYSLPQMGIANFEEIKKDLIEKTEVYKKIVYTDENIQTAKADRSTLNKFIKAVNDERIRIQKEYMKPFESLKAQCDELMKIAEEPKAAIDKVVKEYEAIKQDEKRMNIEGMFHDMFFPEFVDLNQLWNPKWLNATTSMASIETELLNQKNDIIKNCQTLACLPNHSHEAVLFYQKTLDVAGALAKVTEMAEIEAKAKKMAEIEAKKRETENAFIPVPEQSSVIEVERIQEEEAAPEPKMWVGFEAYLNKTQAALLKDFFNENNIDFRPVRTKED